MKGFRKMKIGCIFSLIILCLFLLVGLKDSNDTMKEIENINKQQVHQCFIDMQTNPDLICD